MRGGSSSSTRMDGSLWKQLQLLGRVLTRFAPVVHGCARGRTQHIWRRLCPWNHYPPRSRRLNASNFTQKETFEFLRSILEKRITFLLFPVHVTWYAFRPCIFIARHHSGIGDWTVVATLTKERGKVPLDADESSFVKLAKDMNTFFTTLQHQDDVWSPWSLDMHPVRAWEERRQGEWTCLIWPVPP